MSDILKVSSGFPRDPAMEAAYERKVQEVDTARENAESELERLLRHRRRLLGVLKTDQASEIMVN